MLHIGANGFMALRADFVAFYAAKAWQLTAKKGL